MTKCVYIIIFFGWSGSRANQIVFGRQKVIDYNIDNTMLHTMLKRLQIISSLYLNNPQTNFKREPARCRKANTALLHRQQNIFHILGTLS